MQTDVILRGKGRRDYEEDLVNPWFTVVLSGILHNGLSNVKVLGVGDYSKERFDKEDTLTKYLVPYVYAKDLDEHATEFLEKYCPRALKTPTPLPLDEILESMGLKKFKAPLPDNIFGQTYFSPAHVQVIGEGTGEIAENETSYVEAEKGLIASVCCKQPMMQRIRLPMPRLFLPIQRLSVLTMLFVRNIEPKGIATAPHCSVEYV